MVYIKLFEEVSQSKIIKVLSEEYDKILNVLKVHKLYSVKSTRFYNLTIELKKIINNKFINSTYLDKLKISENDANKLILDQKQQEEIPENELEKIKKIIPNFFDIDYVNNKNDIYLYISLEAKIEICNKNNHFYRKLRIIDNIEGINNTNGDVIELLNIFIKKLKDDYYIIIFNDSYYLKFDQFTTVYNFLRFLFK